MNVLGICGSPRPEGNTSGAVQRALQSMANQGASTRYLSVAEHDIKPCLSCRCCDQGGSCPQADDMAGVLAAMAGADAILIGSPVHFGLVSGTLKVMMDRTRPLRVQGFRLAGKIGAALACGASRNGGQELVQQQIHTFMLIHGMIVVGDGPPTAHFGGAIVGAAEADQTGLGTIDHLAQHVMGVLHRGVFGS